jgi:DNA-binding MarR family transcriptional regulator
MPTPSVEVKLDDNIAAVLRVMVREYPESIARSDLAQAAGLSENILKVVIKKLEKFGVIQTYFPLPTGVVGGRRLMVDLTPVGRDIAKALPPQTSLLRTKLRARQL